MTLAERKQLQHTINAFTHDWLKGVEPLIVDGVLGFATNRRVRTVEWYLGMDSDRIKQLGDDYKRNEVVRRELVRRLRHPMDAQYVPSKDAGIRKAVVYRGRKRRRAQKARYYANLVKAFFTTGVTYFDGKPVAKWMVPYLKYARAHGWTGRLNSGWRDPKYSQQLCYAMCGAPYCAGKCAGLSSNHVGSANPKGAIDVSDYTRFGQIMATMPLPSGAPRLHNSLGSRDPVHFSASGN